MKKIFGLTIAALMVMGLVGGGTWAYFSDTETSTGNVLTAGTLDLNLEGDNSDHKVIEASVTNVKPGDGPNSEYVLLENVGSIAGELDVAISTIVNTESTGSTEYEQDGSPGELGGQAKMVLWIDGNEEVCYINC